MSDSKSRGRLYVYGERGISVSFMVPESKMEEIRSRVYDMLREYYNPSILVLPPIVNSKSKRLTNIPTIIESVVHSDISSLGDFVEVSVLPVNSRRLKAGLYWFGGKYYTSNVVDNNLLILEWTDRDSAEGYLYNLK